MAFDYLFIHLVIYLLICLSFLLAALRIKLEVDLDQAKYCATTHVECDGKTDMIALMPLV